MTKVSKAAQANVHFQRALALAAKGADPTEEYSRGLELHPEEWAYQNRGWVYFRKEDFARAVEDWTKVGDGYAEPRGRARLHLGDVDGAIADFQLALKQEEDPDVRGYLAQAYAAKGERPPGAAKAKAKAKAKAAPPPFEPPARKKNESYDAYVARALASAPLSAATQKTIASLRRPAVFLSPSKSGPREVGASRLGGQPDLPKGTKWPRSRGKPSSFVAQIRLEDVAKLGKTALPKNGLLSFFISEDEDWYLEKATVLHVDTKELGSTALPEDFRRLVDGESKKAAYRPRGIALSIANKLPSPSNALTKKSVRWQTGEEAAYETLYDATVDFSRHQLLGFRDRSYDAEQKATTALLLQCASDGDMSWGDEDHVYFYIPEQALSAGDFSKVFGHSGE